MRDHTKLKVFAMADELVLQVYQATAKFPESERFGLQSQVRRASVSVVANIVEGCARRSHADYLRFLDIAYGSARELQYELDLCRRLGFIDSSTAKALDHASTCTAKTLNRLLQALRTM